MNAQALIWLWAAAMALGLAIGYRKGRTLEGFLWALIFAWLGVVIIALRPKTEAKMIAEERQRQRVTQAAREPGHEPAAGPPPPPGDGQWLTPGS